MRTVKKETGTEFNELGEGTEISTAAPVQILNYRF